MDFRSLQRHIQSSIYLWLILSLLTLAYFPSLYHLWDQWTLWDQALAHGIPTLVLTGWFILKQDFYPLHNLRTYHFWWQLLGLALCSLCWYLFESLGLALPAYLLILVSLFLLIKSSLGQPTLTRLSPYLSLLIFTLPIWGELSPYLVDLSSAVVGYLVKASHLAAVIDGNSIFLPWGAIHIADGCSGVRYLSIALLIAYVIALLNHYRWPQVVTLLTLGGALALIANWLRIYLLVLIGYNSEMKSSLMHNHEAFGWLIFGLIILPAIYFSPIARTPQEPIPIGTPPRWEPLAVLFLGPLLLAAHATNPVRNSPLSLSYLTQRELSVTLPTKLSLPSDLRPSTRILAIGELTLRVDLFTHIPDPDNKKIVPYLPELVNNTRWQRESERIWGSGRQTFKLERYRRLGGSNQFLLATQYRVGEFTLSNYHVAKLTQIPAHLLSQDYFGLLALQVDCQNDCNSEEKLIEGQLAQLALPPAN